MGKFIDLIGQRFGRLTVLSRQGSIGQKVAWLCLCDCGNKRVIISEKLKTGRTKSCGCFQTEQRFKHGMYGIPEYTIWGAMLQRCKNKNNVRYNDYGGRGIAVCRRWEKFVTFYKDMGERPQGLTIERIDNNKGYFPDNCKWATMTENLKNKRNNIIEKEM